MAVDANRVKEHIVRHLKWDDSLKGSKIEVGYIGKIAVLSGTVPNLVAHEAAQRDAQSIPGVDAVENRLVVAFDHHHPNKSDAEIQTDVSKILSCAADADVKDLKVDVKDGLVTLSGLVDAYWKKSRVEDLASSVDGIADIKNNVGVRPVEIAPDYSIKRDILEALERMEVKGLEHLKVEVKEGIVTLAGSVPTWDTAFDVEDTARFTAGVIDVRNRLAVD